MLCRTASDLYWAARNVERAENTARLVDVTLRIALLPERYDRGKKEAAPWRRALDALGAADVVRNRYGRIDAESVQRHLLLAADNPSSVYSCLHAARECARAQRVAITAEMYEDLNVSWLEMRGQTWSRLHADGVNNLLERVKGRSASFRGVTIGKDAVVKNSIVMQGAYVGSGATLNSVIMDKISIIKPDKSLCGTDTFPVYVGKGIVV